RSRLLRKRSRRLPRPPSWSPPRGALSLRWPSRGWPSRGCPSRGALSPRGALSLRGSPPLRGGRWPSACPSPDAPALPWLSWAGAAGASAFTGAGLGSAAGAAAGAALAGAGLALSAAADSVLLAAEASALLARGLRTRFSAVSPASGVLSDKRGFLAKRRAPAAGGRSVWDERCRDGCGGERVWRNQPWQVPWAGRCNRSGAGCCETSTAAGAPASGGGRPVHVGGAGRA